MSSPSAPPMNSGPRRLPMGETRKSMGAERVPMGGDIPSPNRGAAQVRAANRMGADPETLRMKPGYTPTRDSAAPRPDAVPVQAPTQVPMPRPTDPTQPMQRPRTAAMGDTFAVPQNVTALRTALEGKMMQGEPAQLPPELAIGKRMLAEAIARGQMPRIARPEQAPNEAPKGEAPSVSHTRQMPPQQEAPRGPQKFTPSQESNVYYTPDPNAEMEKGKKGKEGKPKDVKLKSNKEGKDNSEYYYRILGVQPGDKQAAATALGKLQRRAASEPWTLSRDEDALLASSAKTEAFHKPMDESSVKKRFEDYSQQQQAYLRNEEKPEGGKSSFVRPRAGDPAELIAQQMIENAGAPVYQGNRMPTQQDVNAGRKDPNSFQQRFQAPEPAQADAATEEEE